MAIALWRLMFTEKRRWELLDDWCGFLESKDIIAIQKDTWDQLLDFAWVRTQTFSHCLTLSADRTVRFLQL